MANTHKGRKETHHGRKNKRLIIRRKQQKTKTMPATLQKQQENQQKWLNGGALREQCFKKSVP